MEQMRWVFDDNYGIILLEPRYEKTCLREFPTRTDSNWPAQLQKLDKSLEI